MASKMAPEQVQIKDFGTLALATVSLWLVTIIIYAISLLFMAGGLIFESCGWAILGLFIMAAAKILALYAIDSWVPGLSIVGFWPKFWIAIACSLFTLSGTPGRYEYHDDNRYW
jgi:hypothetical protein